MARINRKFFFEHARATLFGGRLAPAQFAGLTAILDAWDADAALLDDRWLAYMYATAYHETDRKLQPITEYGNTAYFNRRYGPEGDNPRLARELGNTRPGDGARYRGRGFVQLTGRGHYAKWGERLGVPLEDQPDLACDLAIATRVMIEGMRRGLFTGKGLPAYFDGDTEDWKGARRIINGQDKAEIIAGYGRSFYACISRRP